MARERNQRHSQMVAKLKEKGFRLTPQRLAVIRILASSDEHLSADKIYERVRGGFPSTSLATIYKTVSVLKKVGEIMELGFVDDSNRYDGTRPYPHPHLVCIECRKILDPSVPALDELPLQLAKKTGYNILHHRLDFFGICPACRKRKIQG